MLVEEIRVAERGGAQGGGSGIIYLCSMRMYSKSVARRRVKQTVGENSFKRLSGVDRGGISCNIHVQVH